MTRGKLGWVVALGALVGVGAMAEVASAQFAPQARPLYGFANLQSGFMPDPHLMRGVIGGTVQASQFNPNCRGIVNPQPSHVIRSGSGFRNIPFVVSGQSDSTLMVMLPNGAVVCDDDGGEGNNPLVQTSSPPGEIRVWVGAYSSGHAGQPYTLGVTELSHITANNLGMGGPGPMQPPMPPPPPVAGINPNGPPSFGTVGLRSGFMPDPHVIAGRAGGPISASAVDGSCRGYISPQPNHVLMSQSGFRQLRLLVNSSTDTTLVVMAPNGQIICNDDGGGSSGLNPLVALSSTPGPIRVWVGTYSASGAGAAYNLGFTELGHVTTQNIPPPGGYVQQPIQPQPIQPQPIQPVASIVQMQASIPVTLIGPGLDPGTVALWQPGGGPATQITLSGSNIVAGGASIVSLPPSMREPVVTVMQQRNGQLLVRAEQPPMGRGDRGETMIVLVSWQGRPVVQDQWTGRFGQRGPRWAR
jgi:hypothetical protein